MAGKKDWVRSVMRGGKAEKIPVGFWHHYLLDGQEDMSGALDDPEMFDRNIAGAKEYHDAFDQDFVKIMTDGYFYLPLTIADDLKAETLVTIDEDREKEYTEGICKLVKTYREIYGDDTLLFVNIFGPAATVYNLINERNHGDRSVLMRAQLANPEAFGRAYDLLAEHEAALIKKLVGPGMADGIYLSVTSNSTDPTFYAKHAQPADEKVIAAANALSQDNILHICGWRGRTNDLKVFRDYDVEVMNVAVHSDGMTLGEAKKFFTKAKAVLGGFGNMEGDVLYSGTKEEIEAEVKKILDEAGEGGVLVGADCTTPMDINVEHLKWVKAAVQG